MQQSFADTHSRIKCSESRCSQVASDHASFRTRRSNLLERKHQLHSQLQQACQPLVADSKPRKAKELTVFTEHSRFRPCPHSLSLSLSAIGFLTCPEDPETSNGDTTSFCAGSSNLRVFALFLHHLAPLFLNSKCHCSVTLFLPALSALLLLLVHVLLKVTHPGCINFIAFFQHTQGQACLCCKY